MMASPEKDTAGGLTGMKGPSDGAKGSALKAAGKVVERSTGSKSAGDAVASGSVTGTAKGLARNPVKVAIAAGLQSLGVPAPIAGWCGQHWKGILGTSLLMQTLPFVLVGALSVATVSDQSGIQSEARAVDAGVPFSLFDNYKEAAIGTGVPWEMIAATAQIQTDHGQNAGDGIYRFQPGSEGYTRAAAAAAEKGEEYYTRISPATYPEIKINRRVDPEDEDSEMRDYYGPFLFDLEKLQELGWDSGSEFVGASLSQPVSAVGGVHYTNNVSWSSVSLGRGLLNTLEKYADELPECPDATTDPVAEHCYPPGVPRPWNGGDPVKNWEDYEEELVYGIDAVPIFGGNWAPPQPVPSPNCSDGNEAFAIVDNVSSSSIESVEGEAKGVQRLRSTPGNYLGEMGTTDFFGNAISEHPDRPVWIALGNFGATRELHLEAQEIGPTGPITPGDSVPPTTTPPTTTPPEEEEEGGGEGPSLAERQKAEYIEALRRILDQVVPATSARTTIILPRVIPEEYESPVNEGYAEAVSELVSKYANVSVFDGSKWVYDTNQADPPLPPDAGFQEVSMFSSEIPLFESNMFIPSPAGQSAYGEYLLDQMCPTPAPPEPGDDELPQPSYRSRQIVALAISWKTGRSMCGAGPTSGGTISKFYDDVTLNGILKATRWLESREDYESPENAVLASGAYQILTPEWGKWRDQGAPGDTSRAAFEATPEVQDAAAAARLDFWIEDRSKGLDMTPEDLIPYIPILWYVPGYLDDLLDGRKSWSEIPPGNHISYGDYRDAWNWLYQQAMAGNVIPDAKQLDYAEWFRGRPYDGPSEGTGGPDGGTGYFSPVTLCVGNGMAGGIPNPLQGPFCDGLGVKGGVWRGRPRDSYTPADMTVTEYAGMSFIGQPEAGAAWADFIAYSEGVGWETTDFRGTIWGDRSAPGASKSSTHPIGLAIDVDVLFRGGKYNPLPQHEEAGEPYPVDAAWGGPPTYEPVEFMAWMYSDAWKFGWCSPRWARPLRLGGTAQGGRYAGGGDAGLETWHYDFGAYQSVDPDLLNEPKDTDGSGPVGIAD